MVQICSISLNVMMVRLRRYDQRYPWFFKTVDMSFMDHMARSKNNSKDSSSKVTKDKNPQEKEDK